MKWILILILLSGFVCASNLTSSTTSGQNWVFTSHEDPDWQIELCNHIDGCDRYDANVNVSVNTSKDWSIKIVPILLNFTDVNTYIDELDSNYLKLIWVMGLIGILAVLAKMLRLYVSGKL